MDEQPKIDAFMPIYWGDYFADTKDFDALEHGVYLCLLGHMWRSGGTLPNDQKRLSRICNLHGRASKRVLNFVLSKFKIVGDVITHKRVDKELEKAKLRRNKAQTAINKRWENHTPSNTKRNTRAHTRPIQPPSPSPSKILVRTTKKKVIDSSILIGKYVRMAQADIDIFKKEDGDEDFKTRCETLDDYCSSTGRRYKDYAAAYRNFRKRDFARNSNGFKPQKKKMSWLEFEAWAEEEDRKDALKKQQQGAS